MILVPSTSFHNIDPANDGTMKLQSDMKLYIPRVTRNNNNRVNASEAPLAVKNYANGVPKLLDLCISVLSKNVSNIDHVGLLPYELFAQIVKDAPTEDLYRIQKCNPVSNFSSFLSGYFIHVNIDLLFVKLPGDLT